MKRFLLAVLASCIAISGMSCDDNDGNGHKPVGPNPGGNGGENPGEEEEQNKVDPELACEAGQTKCDGFLYMTCDTTKKEFVVTQCPFKMHCEVLEGVATCTNGPVEPKCTEGMAKCVGNMLRACVDGDYEIPGTDCTLDGGYCVSEGDTARCKGGTSEPWSCVAGENKSRCNETGSIVMRCANGVTQEYNCAEIGKECRVDASRNAECVEVPCQSGATKCGAGNILSTCVNGVWQKEHCTELIPQKVCNSNGNPSPKGEYDLAACIEPPQVVDTVDTDGDTIPDTIEGRQDNVDTDKDSIPDYLDLDSDNDTIPDEIEGRMVGSVPADSDGDTVPDFRDEDSDNNKILDRDEACLNFNGSKQKCVTELRPVGVEESGADLTETYTAVIVPSNFNLGDVDDPGPDYLDEDNDGDGRGDEDEIHGLTIDGDTPDGKYAGLCKNSGVAGTPAQPLDCDGDTIPDYVSLDSDGDGLPDFYEGAYFKVKDGLVVNGVAAPYAIYARYNPDADGDTVPDAEEATLDAGTGVWTLWDSDDDGAPDILETDSDGDSLSDGYEYDLEKKSPCKGVMQPRRQKDTDGDTFNDAAENAVAVESMKQTCNPSSDPECHKFEPERMVCDNNIGVKSVYEFYFELDPKLEGEVPSQELEFIPTVTKLDVVFNIDTTGSMQAAINSVKNNVSTMVTKIKSMVDDSGFGVTAFDDFPIRACYDDVGTEGIACGKYNADTDVPFEVIGNVSTESGEVAGNVAKIPDAANGADVPESGAESLYQIATGAGVTWYKADGTAQSVNAVTNSAGTWGGAKYRADSLPVVIHITDAPSHDVSSSAYNLTIPDYMKYITTQYSKGYVKNPHYSKDLIPVLKDKGIRVITLKVPDGEGKLRADDYGQMTTWAKESGAIVPACAFKTEANAWDCNGDHTAEKCCLGTAASSPVTIDGKQRCILHYTGAQAEVANYIPLGVSALVKYTTYDVATRVRGEAIPGKSVDTSCFIKEIVALRYAPPEREPEKSCNPQAQMKKFNASHNYNDGFTNFAPGTSTAGSTDGAKLYFTVSAKKTGCVEQTGSTQVYKAYIDVYDPLTNLLFDTQQVSILIPPITENTNG